VTEFSQLGVTHVDILLNRNWTSYGVYNKPFVCAHAERQINAEFLVFVDSDQVIFNEPCGLLISNDYIAAARPVNLVNIGVSTLAGDGRNQEYWRRLYDLCGVSIFSLVKPMLEDCEILAYFNSGMISTRPRAGIWGRWAGNFERVMRLGLQPTDPFFIEQSVFSATISSMNAPVSLLPPSYSYPLPAHHGLEDGKQIKQLEKMVSIHYHRIFDNGNWLPFLTHLPCLERRSPRYEWLIQNLSELDE